MSGGRDRPPPQGQVLFPRAQRPSRGGSGRGLVGPWAEPPAPDEKSLEEIPGSRSLVLLRGGK